MPSDNRLIVYQGPPNSGKRCRLVSAYRELSPSEQTRSVFLTVSDGARRELEDRLRSDDSPGPPVWTLARLAREVMRAFGVEPPGALNESERRIAIAGLIRGLPGDGGTLKRWASAAASSAADVAALVGLLERHRVCPKKFGDWAKDSGSDALKAAAAVYEAYDSFQAERNLADFDRRNVLALDLLSDRRPKSLPDIVFVDNGQEMDALQARLVAALAGTEGRIVAAVDTWLRAQMYRGAVPDAKAALEAAAEVEAHVVPLGEQTPAQNLFEGERRLDGLAGHFDSPRFVFGSTQEDQYDRVAEAVEKMCGTTAILARSNAVAAAWREALASRGIAVADHAPAVAFVGRFLRDALTVFAEDDKTDSDLPARKRAAAIRLLDLKGHDTSSERREPKARGIPAALEEALAGACAEVGLARRVHRLALWSGWVRRPDARAARAYGRAMEVLARRDEISELAGNGPLTAADALRNIESLVGAATAPEERAPRPAPDSGAPEEVESVARSAEVDVLTVHSAAGRHWDNVVIVELEERRFPQHAAPSPWFSPSDAEKVCAWLSGETGAAVSLGRFERSELVTVEEERRLFLTAMTRGTKVSLSCHLAEDERDLAPSPYLLALFKHFPTPAPQGAESGCDLQAFLPEGHAAVRCGACGRGPCAAVVEAEESAETEDEPARAPAPEPTAAAVPDARPSATALNEWFKCPRRYFLGRVLRLDEAEGDALAGGNLVHKAMELFHTGASRTPEALDACIEKAAQDAEVSKGFSSAAALAMAVRRAREAGRLYLTKRSYDGVAIASGEKLETISLDGHALYVKMDAVFRDGDGRLEVVDFKSGTPKEKASDLKKVQPQVNGDGSVKPPEKEDADVQMALYAVAKRGDNLARVTHEYVCLKQPHKTSGISLTVIEGGPGANPAGFTTGDLEALAAFFGQQAAAIKARKRFEPVPRLGECGDYRVPCPFVAVCDREEVPDA